MLTELDEYIFKGLHELTMLVLYENSLIGLPAGIFDDTTKLNHLELHDNMLTELDQHIFRGLHELTILSLSTNQLRSLPPG